VTLFGQVATLTFDLLTTISNEFIVVVTCTNTVNLVKFCQVIYEILCSHMDTHMHIHTDGRPS